MEIVERIVLALVGLMFAAGGVLYCARKIDRWRR
jgi:hypothetical protein